MENTRKKAILVDVIDPMTNPEDAQTRLNELESLVTTYGGVSVVKVIQRRSLPDYKTYIGSGKLDEIKEMACENEAELLIINNILKPRQIYNLNEKLRDLKVDAWDRVDLILKIFSKHAQSTQAKLQIELAGIRHMGPRIYDMGIELSQQRGGTATRGGQGETNTEMMKRHLRKQELNILKKLEHYETIHEGHRSRRRKNNLKTVALVGYTNAGKSSLLNALTNKGAYVADALFATLDTRVGKIYVPAEQDEETFQYTPGKELLVSDTIGFIQDLPPNLIKAFKSTLSETVEADLLLHVIDVNDPQVHMKIDVVEDILQQLGLEDKQKIYVFNKVDLIASPSIFDNHRERSSLMKAGSDTSEILGWESSKRNDLAKEKMEKLHEKFKHHKPHFISVYREQNLDSLIEKVFNHL